MKALHKKVNTKSILLSIFNSLFERRCFSCHKISQKNLCDSCYRQINFLYDRGCQRCAHESLEHKPQRCLYCENIQWSFKCVKAATPYCYPVRDMLISFKNQRSPVFAEELARLLMPLIERDKIDLFVPVPQSYVKHLMRGCHPVGKITKELSQLIEIPWRNVLKKRIISSDQKSKKEHERKKSLSHCFKATTPLNGERIALIDDVLTTGTTAQACSQALLNVGAKQVTVVVVARQMRKNVGG